MRKKNNKKQYRIFRNKKEITIVMGKEGQEGIVHSSTEPSQILQLLLTALDDNWTIETLGVAHNENLHLMKEIEKGTISSRDVEERIHQWQRYFDSVADFFKLTMSSERQYYELQHAIFNVLHGKRCGDVAYHPLTRYRNVKLMEKLMEEREKVAHYRGEVALARRDAGNARHENVRLNQLLLAAQQERQSLMLAAENAIHRTLQRTAISHGQDIYFAFVNVVDGDFISTPELHEIYNWIASVQVEKKKFHLRKYLPRHETQYIRGDFRTPEMQEMIDQISAAIEMPSIAI